MNRVMLINSEELAAKVKPILLDTEVITVDPEQLGNPLYRNEIAANCGDGCMVYTPVDLLRLYQGNALGGLQGLLGMRLTSIPMKVADIEKDPTGLLAILLAADNRQAADDAEFNQQLQEKQEAKKRAGKLEAPPLDTLLDSISVFISDYVIFARPPQKIATALWIVHTHLFEQFDTSPCLAITSPEKRSGKSRLLDTLQLLVARPWRAILPSDAVVFRKIEASKPTLLLDEVDAIFGAKTAAQYEGLRALLNAGHRKGATIPRCLERGFEVKDYSVYCPKALAGIGNLPDTVADRSIPIRLARRTKQEIVRKFRFREVGEAAGPLRAEIEAYTAGVDLSGIYPEMPDELNDRAADSWEPLLSIADAAGGKWPELARQAALSLSVDVEPDDDSLGIRLLADCQTVFVQIGADRITLVELLDLLNGLEESPWNDFGYTTRKLASMLRRYGVKSGTHRFENKTAKGYLKSDFKDAWIRYSPSNTDFSGNIGNNGLTMRVTSQNTSVTEKEMLPNKNSLKPSDRTNVTDVTEQTPYIGAEEEKQTPEPELDELKEHGRLAI